MPSKPPTGFVAAGFSTASGFGPSPSCAYAAPWKSVHARKLKISADSFFMALLHDFDSDVDTLEFLTGLYVYGMVLAARIPAEQFAFLGGPAYIVARASEIIAAVRQR